MHPSYYHKAHACIMVRTYLSLWSEGHGRYSHSLDIQLACAFPLLCCRYFLFLLTNPLHLSLSLRWLALGRLITFSF